MSAYDVATIMVMVTGRGDRRELHGSGRVTYGITSTFLV